MKKLTGLLILMLVLCSACQVGNQAQGGIGNAFTASPVPTQGIEEASQPEGSSPSDAEDACLSTATTYVSQEALLAALRDEKALEKDANLRKVKYWYYLKNIPEDYVEYACMVSDTGNVRVQYVTEKAYEWVEKHDPTHVRSYETPLSVSTQRGYDFEIYVKHYPNGRWIEDRIYYYPKICYIDWLEGEEYLSIYVPRLVDEDGGVHVQELTDEQVLTLTEVVRVDPFK